MAKNLGKVGFALKGEWSAVVTYDQLEVVFYEGKVYAAKRSSTNAQPDSSPADWMMWAGSPVITSSAITGGHAVTITNADGTSETINVLDGEVTNEVLSETLDGLIGDLSNLTTTDKSNVVAAINELNSDVDELQEGMETKAEIDGSYSSMTVGNAEQLVSTVGVTDSVPYLFRTSGGSNDIGDREVDKLIGGTVAWNQLVPTANKDVTSDKSDTRSLYFVIRQSTSPYTMVYSKQNVQAGVLEGVVTSSFDGYVEMIHIGSQRNISLTPNNLFSFITGHKYYFTLNFTSVDTSVVGGVVAKDIQVFDLTQMFGRTIADYLYTLESGSSGSGISKAKSWGYFLKDYYPYSEGALQSVQTSAHKMVGFNQWDEESEDGYYDVADGEKKSSSSWKRCKNLIPCIPNTSYYMYFAGSGTEGAVLYYNASKEIISYKTTGFKNVVTTTPNDCYYMAFYMNPSYFTDDICINLHWDGERDGEYEEYKLRSYPLDSSLTLRGVPKLDANNSLYYDGDTYESDGTVTRKYISVHLGSQRWNYSDAEGHLGFYCDNVGAKVPSTTAHTIEMICAKYDKVSYNSAYENIRDKIIAVRTNGGLRVYDTSYTDAESFTTAMNGVYLVCEAATPTTEYADPYQNPQIVDDWGTEEYVDSRTVPIPVGHETLYQANLKAKLEVSPNSPSGDGDYIVRQTSGINKYVQLVIPDELPTMPSEDGTYALKVTVASGVPILTWEAEA